MLEELSYYCIVQDLWLNGAARLTPVLVFAAREVIIGVNALMRTWNWSRSPSDCMKLAAFSSMPWLVKNIFPAEMLSLPKVAFLLSFSHVSFLFLVKMGPCMSRSLAICGPRPHGQSGDSKHVTFLACWNFRSPIFSVHLHYQWTGGFLKAFVYFNRLVRWNGGNCMFSSIHKFFQ